MASTRPSVRALAGASLAALTLAACASSGGPRPLGGAAEAKPEAESHEVAPAERALAKAEREFTQAELGVVLEELEARAKLADAEEELRAARAALEAKRLARAAFDGEAELRQRRAENEVIEAESRLTAERADLAGIQRIYELEPEVTVKEEILRRNAENVRRAEEELALSKLEAERLVAVELAAERLELDEELRAAEGEVLSKERALDAAKLAGRKSVEAARNELLEARDGVAEAREELAEARG